MLCNNDTENKSTQTILYFWRLWSWTRNWWFCTIFFVSQCVRIGDMFWMMQFWKSGKTPILKTVYTSLYQLITCGSTQWLRKTVNKFYRQHLTITDFFEFSQFTGTRGHAYKLYKSRSVCTVRMNFFANRVINAWNNLPTSVSFTSLPAFSRTIRSVDFRIFLKCSSC